MKRDPSLLVGKQFELLVIGGGVYGACIARDAALRGLSVALIDKGDFCGATSHNSLKLIHGGLRYLQHFDLRRVRHSVVERRIWSTIAPHLIRPLKFVMPTYGHGTRGPEAFRAAMILYEMVGFGGNRGLSARGSFPRGQVVGRAQVEQLVPGVNTKGLTGAAIWYDGQMSDADRVVLECLQSALQHDAVLANYVSAEKLTGDSGRIGGVRARDMLAGDSFEIRADVVINASGPWIGRLLRSGPLARSSREEICWTRAMNLVTRKLPVPHAIGMESGRVSTARVGKTRRLFFLTPWKDCTAIGTSQLPYDGDPDEYRFEEAEVVEFLEELNLCFSTTLTRQDVHYCHAGLTPADESPVRDEVARGRRDVIVDHYRERGVHGLISVIGVKFTTARAAAEKAVDLAFSKLGRAVPSCTASTTPLPGARDFEATQPMNPDAGQQEAGAFDAQTALAERYGALWRTVYRYCPSDRQVSSEDCFQAQCQHAVDHEMAVTLGDVLLRRTDRVARGVLGPDDVTWCVDMMARKLAWDAVRQKRELDEFRGVLIRHGQQLPDSARSCVEPRRAQ